MLKMHLEGGLAGMGAVLVKGAGTSPFAMLCHDGR